MFSLVCHRTMIACYYYTLFPQVLTTKIHYLKRMLCSHFSCIFYFFPLSFLNFVASSCIYLNVLQVCIKSICKKTKRTESSYYSLSYYSISGILRVTQFFLYLSLPTCLSVFLHIVKDSLCAFHLHYFPSIHIFFF